MDVHPTKHVSIGIDPYPTRQGKVCGFENIALPEFCAPRLNEDLLPGAPWEARIRGGSAVGSGGTVKCDFSPPRTKIARFLF